MRKRKEDTRRPFNDRCSGVDRKEVGQKEIEKNHRPKFH